MGRTVRLLLLEDSPADAELTTEELTRSGMCVISERVDTEADFRQALRQFNPHVVISDHSLSQFDAIAALAVLHAEHSIAPLILVSGAFTEEVVMTCLRRGAADLVLKRNLNRLAPSIDAALAVREPLERLSPRQLEVMRLVAEGKSTREIAHRLRRSVKTIEAHRSEVMNRLGIHGVVGLVRYAVRVGLVVADQESALIALGAPQGST